MSPRARQETEFRRRRLLGAALVLVVLAAIVAVSLVLLGSERSDGGSVRETGTGTVDPAPGIRVDDFAIDSRAVGRKLGVAVMVPPGNSQGRALLVFLHGAGGDQESFLASRAVRRGLARLGAEAPVVAFPEGEESWWHDRADGDWGRYVVTEVIPAVTRRLGTDPRRVAIGGISMGGFGAYHLALEWPDRFCAVGGHSAGLWNDPADEYPGAFDDLADFERNDVVAAVEGDPDAFGSTPVWNDYGDEDWFVAGNAALVAALEAGRGADLTARVWPGGHDGTYWDAHFAAYLRFYADSLARCS